MGRLGRVTCTVYLHKKIMWFINVPNPDTADSVSLDQLGPGDHESAGLRTSRRLVVSCAYVKSTGAYRPLTYTHNRRVGESKPFCELYILQKVTSRHLATKIAITFPFLFRG